MNRTILAIFALAASMLSSCAGRPLPEPAAVGVPNEHSRAVAIFETRGGPVSWADLVGASQEADVVILGEQHGNPTGLSAAAALWRDLLAASPANGRTALALEFFERDEQSRLDDFLSGLSDERTLVRRTGRDAAGSPTGNWPPGHRDMVIAARDAGRPVVAANAPRPYVRLARRSGFEALRSLTVEQQRLFRVPDAPPTGRYRADFDLFMNGGPPMNADEQASTDATFRAQSLWDWTMAESVAAASAAGHRPVVLVVGQFHTDFDGGLVQALRLLRPSARIVTASFRSETAHDAAALAEEDRGRADFVIGTGLTR